MKYLLIIIFLITACASGVQKLRRIDPGMTPQEVDVIMGPRDGFKVVEKEDNNFLLYRYINHLCNGHVSIREKCDFFVVFKNNKVIETGVKDVRGGDSSMQFLYIFNLKRL
jgi:hypothetical protein